MSEDRINSDAQSSAIEHLRCLAQECSHMDVDEVNDLAGRDLYTAIDSGALSGGEFLHVQHMMCKHVTEKSPPDYRTFLVQAVTMIARIDKANTAIFGALVRIYESEGMGRNKAFLENACRLLADLIENQPRYSQSSRNGLNAEAEVNEPACKTPENDSSLIYQAAAADFYNIPASMLSKMSKRSEGEPGYLWSGRKKGRVFYRKRDLERVWRSRQKLKGSKFPLCSQQKK